MWDQTLSAHIVIHQEMGGLSKRQAKYFNLDTKIITIKMCWDIFHSKAFQESYLITKVAELNAVSVLIIREEESKETKQQQCVAERIGHP